MHKEAVIIGAGPSGVSAAIGLKRAGRSFHIFERCQVGGLLRQANCVENYPGFSGGISGNKLSDCLAGHLSKLGVKPIYERVDKVSWNGKEFEIESVSASVRTSYLVVASGTKPKTPAIEIPSQAKKYVHSSILDLNDTEDSKIVIIGGGDVAFDYSLNLARRNKVFLLYRSASSCLPLLYERVNSNPQIEVIKEAHIESIIPKNDGVKLFYNKGGKNLSIGAHHVLFAVGRVAECGFLSDNISPAEITKLQEKKKLYLVGDVKNGNLRHAAIAAGDGLRAAMEIIEDMRD